MDFCPRKTLMEVYSKFSASSLCFLPFYQDTNVQEHVVPVCRGREHPQDYVPAVHPDDGAGGVEQVKVEVGVTRDRTVQTGLQERGPLLLKDTLGATLITFTHPSNS